MFNKSFLGEKRFQCAECLKRFMRSDHLSKHLKTHQARRIAQEAQAQQQVQNALQIQTNSEENTLIITQPDMNIDGDQTDTKPDIGQLAI